MIIYDSPIKSNNEFRYSKFTQISQASGYKKMRRILNRGKNFEKGD